MIAVYIQYVWKNNKTHEITKKNKNILLIVFVVSFNFIQFEKPKSMLLERLI